MHEFDSRLLGGNPKSRYKTAEEFKRLTVTASWIVCSRYKFHGKQE